MGFIHRDLKPDNFLIAADGKFKYPPHSSSSSSSFLLLLLLLLLLLGHLKLADFGLSTRGQNRSREPFAGQLPELELAKPT